MTWKCKFCKTKNDDSNNVCTNCGNSRGLSPVPSGGIKKASSNAGFAFRNSKVKLGNFGSKIKNKIKKPNPASTLQPSSYLTKCQYCGEEYSPQRSNCPKCKAPNPSPGQAQSPNVSNNVKCKYCGSVVPVNVAQCPSCGAPNDNVVKCLGCSSSYNKNLDECPFCKTRNPFRPKKEKPKSLREQAGKRISPRKYEILASFLLGLFLYVGTPIIGLPSFAWMALAFMFFIPIHIGLPGQREVLASIGDGNEGSFASWGGGSIAVKSACKILAFAFIIFELFAYNRLISLIVAFVMYFMLPTKYKTSQPYKALEAWSRVLLGIFMAMLFYNTFGGVGFFPIIGAGNTVANSLFFMGLAFFATLPNQEEGDEDDARINIKVYSKITSHGAFNKAESSIFLILMLVSLAAFTNFQLPLDMMSIVFYFVWLMSLFIGLTSGPEARPAMGIITILIAMFVFSSTYTGVVGQALFGYWWPQVQSGVEMIFAPMDEMLFQAQSGMSDAWLMMTNPQAYLQSQQQNQQVTTSSSIGTRNSIEVDKFELASNVLDPSIETLFGDINLKNEGEFNADYIKMTLSAKWRDPVAENSDTYLDVGSISKMTCSGGVQPEQSGNSMYCEWVGDSTRPAAYPTETAYASFTFSKEGWDSLGQCCRVITVDGEDMKCEENPETCSVGTSYVHSGETVKIRAEYDYNYNVNVSIPIEVIPFAEYERLISSKQIKLGELRSEYTGGPVKATIYSREQPIKDGELSFIRASLYNEGKGNITGISNFTIMVPAILNPQPLDSDTYTFTSCLPWQTSGEFRYTECKYIVDEINHPEIERSKYKTVVFMIEPDIETDYSQTSLITGIASYSYSMTKDKSIQIASAPFA